MGIFEQPDGFYKGNRGLSEGFLPEINENLIEISLTFWYLKGGEYVVINLRVFKFLFSTDFGMVMTSALFVNEAYFYVRLIP
jgi:hypothetical protein